MERKINLTNKSILIILHVMYAVGILGHLLEPMRDFMLLLTPFTLLFTGGLVVYSTIKEDKEIIKWLLFTYTMTFFVEVFGVKTGYIFGDYDYGDVLGIKLFETPLIIGLNWILVILGAVLIARRINTSILFVTFAAPLFAVLFDFILEPVAVKLNYWTWSGDIIPLQNYLAWYIIALLFSFYYSILKIKIRTNVVIHYFLVQLTFFMILNLTL